MAEQNRQDWVAPALLIVAALVIALVVWAVYAATRSDAEPETLTEEVEAYTACLADHGANVPVIETSPDGGFVVIVPGSLLEGDIDLERFAEARRACRHLEPNLLGRLFAGGFGLDQRGPGAEFFRDRDVPFGGIRELCEQLIDREIQDFDVPPEIAEICHDLGF